MTTVAVSVATYSRFFRQEHARTVLDYGAGTLRNALYLTDQGFTVYAADLREQLENLRSHPEVHRLAGLIEVEELERARLGVDLVLSTYVFNIIRQQTERQRYLENVVRNLRPGGCLLIEVCSRPHELAGEATRRSAEADGSPACNHQQLDLQLAPFGLRRICHYYRHHAVAAIYRLSCSP